MRVKTRTAIESPIRLQEKDFQKQITDLALLRGWLVYSIPDSRRASCRGYPDLCIVRQGRVGEVGRLIYAELKTEKGRLRPEQKIWLEALRSVAGIEIYTWKPHDMDAILRILQ